MINLLNFIFLQIPTDSVTIEMLQEIIANSSVESTANIWDTLFKILIATAMGSGGIYALVKYIIKKRANRKDATNAAILERSKTEQEHSNTLETEMFNFDKAKYMNIQDANQTFQKTIINEIFGKFVEQSQWITNLHDKSIEQLVEKMTDVNKITKDLYVQNDVLSNRIRNVEDRVLKNSSIIIARLDTLLKVFKKEN